MLKINEDFKRLIPPLTQEEYKQLEDNILKEGIREKIITWDGYIIDGHNRYNIAMQWQLDYETESMYFEDESDVKIWMINNQFGRRNLIPYQRSVLALELKKEIAAKAKMNQIRKPNFVLQNSAEQNSIDTRKELANVAGVSHDTISRVETIQAKASEEVKQKLSTGEVSINQAYQEIKKEEKQIELKNKKEEYKKNSLKEVELKPEIYLKDAVTYLNTFDDNSIDLIITDPPYATDIDDIKSFTNDWLNVALKKVKQNGRLYICSGAYPNELKAFLDVLMNQTKFIVDNPLIWTYRNTLGVTPKMKYNLNYQVIWHLYSNESKELDTSITNEMFSVQDINAPDGRIGNRLHTWQKPDELANRLIRHGSVDGDLVVDCFACTGTFLIAASKFNRIAKGCDISQENINIAKERGCTIVGI
jgi:DNA modification methylase